MNITTNRYNFCLILGLCCLLISCSESEQAPPLDTALLSSSYENYKENRISKKRFGYEVIQPLIQNRSADFTVETLGNSVEGRPVHSLTYGEGNLKVMLWSQMHGNESTATMALFDLFNFLESSNDEFVEIREEIKEKLQVKFIPMVNPDGAERFQRRNALGIDLNRDAIRLSSPEALILKEARDAFDPSFGFNLHDQNIYYNAENTSYPATISVLAPAYNEATEINEVRSNAMKVIVGMNKILQEETPGHVGKYNDAFEPRAFGDNFQKWGTSTILIESGGYPNDPEKQYIRKLNFMIILNALYEIATSRYENYEVDDYFNIPDNDSKMMDLLIRNVSMKEGDYTFQADVGIRRQEQDTAEEYYFEGTIQDLGDLSIYYGYEEVDSSGLEMLMGKVWEDEMEWKDLSLEKAIELLNEGYIAVKTDEAQKGRIHDFPIGIYTGEKPSRFEEEMGNSTYFFLRENGEVKYAVINGYLVDMNDPEMGEMKHKVY